MINNNFAAAVALSAAAMLTHGCTPAGAGAELRTEAVARKSISTLVTATGTVEPVRLVEVGTQVSGRIERIYVDYNSVVTRGQVIAEMDKVTLKAELDQAEASLAQDKAQADYQRKNYERQQTLHDKALISDQEFDDATYAWESADASYRQQQASMVRIRQNLEYAIITSPVDGVVISRAVEEGQTVASGFSTPTLFTIAQDLKDMRVIADVDEADIGEVAEGQRVEFAVDAYPDDVFEGQVTQVRLEATTESSVVTYEVVISAYNPDLKLKPGLTANVSIFTTERTDVPVMPQKALRFVPDAEALAALHIGIDTAADRPAPGTKAVWALRRGTLVPVGVTTGATQGADVEVTAGLAAGDTVAVEMLTASTAATPTATEQSPFMPKRPGQKK